MLKRDILNLTSIKQNGKWYVGWFFIATIKRNIFGTFEW